MKLDTAEKILEWAAWQGTEDHKGHSCDDTTTAERLALAMRVLAIVEKRAKGEGHCGQDELCTYCPAVLDYCQHILREAAKGEGK